MSVRQFGSIEELFASLDADRKFAAENRHPMQSAVTFGSRAVSTADAEVLIFGWVYTEAEFLAAEMNAGADEEEARSGWRRIMAAEAEGMVFGTWYSVVEPEGEIGSQNKISLWPILPGTFDAVRAARWDPTRFSSWLNREVVAAVCNTVEHRQSIYRG